MSNYYNDKWLKKILIFLILILLLVFSIFSYLNFNKHLRVAHAGGKFNNKIYSNSISSIEQNLKFTKYFELDLQLTNDGRLICSHDYAINTKPIRDVKFNEIKNEIIKNDYCYDETLKELLLKHDDIKIITDFKTDNIEGLNFIKEFFQSNFNSFIPQIYFENEYKKVKDLGFDKIIFTFYKIPKYSNDQIIKFLDEMDLYAITMDPARLRSGILRKIKNQKIFTYVYTINSRLRFLQYKLFFSADEIYTDSLF